MVKQIKWPVRYRSEEVECTLCKEPTRDQQAICGDCRQLYKLGKQAKKALVEGEKKLYHFEQYISLDGDWHHRFYISELLTKLTGEAHIDFHFPRPMDAYNEGRILTEVTINPNGTPNFGNTSYGAILLTESQADVCKRFFQALNKALSEAKKDGQRDGGYFIRKLAEGSLNIDQVNAWHTKSEDKA